MSDLAMPAVWLAIRGGHRFKTVSALDENPKIYQTSPNITSPGLNSFFTKLFKPLPKIVKNFLMILGREIISESSLNNLIPAKSGEGGKMKKEILKAIRTALAKGEYKKYSSLKRLLPLKERHKV